MKRSHNWLPQQGQSKRPRTNDGKSQAQQSTSTFHQLQQQPSFQPGSNSTIDFSQDIWPPGWKTLSPNGSSWSLEAAVVNPESFLELGNIFCKKFSDYPKNNLKEEQFSTEIWSHFIQNQQPIGAFKQKIELWYELNRVLSCELSCSSHAFGSTLNGFGSSESDLDLCLFFRSTAVTNKEKQNADISTLARARNILRRTSHHFLSTNMELVPAKIPILKVYDTYGNLEVDLSCNNPLSVNNTHLLFCYSQLDYRVRPLVITIKSWAKKARINEAKDQTLSSYTLTLMVLHFLQAGVSPPVVPALQTRNPNLFGNLPINQLSFFKNLPTFESNNNMPLGELLKGFFDYYNNVFDFTRDVGSVRTGEVLTINACHDYARAHQLGPRQWEAYVCIEEPFERTNAGRAIISRPRFDQILRAIKRADLALKTGEPSLKKLFDSATP